MNFKKKNNFLRCYQKDKYEQVPLPAPQVHGFPEKAKKKKKPWCGVGCPD